MLSKYTVMSDFFAKSSVDEFAVCVLIQTVNQELQEVKLLLSTEREKVCDLEDKFKLLEVRGYTNSRSY